jgi:hypothetical protein
MHVMVKSIEGLYGDDFGYFEAEAMMSHAENVFKAEMSSLDRIIRDLREAGAKILR